MLSNHYRFPSTFIEPLDYVDNLWTTKPGKRELWSYLTYAMSTGREKYVKIFLTESTIENHKRYVGATFHSAQESKKFLIDNPSAWPGDRSSLQLDDIRTDGLLRAWSKVWSGEVEQCVRTSAESAERFVENFNTVGSTLQVKVPKTFVDKLLSQIHHEPDSMNYQKYGHMAGYFFPDRPFSDKSPDEDTGDRSPSTSSPIEVPEIPFHRRVYSFVTICVDSENQKATKFAFVRSRIRSDQYFIAATPNFHHDHFEALTAYWEDATPYPKFHFDAKWMLEELIATATMQHRGTGLNFLLP